MLTLEAILEMDLQGVSTRKIAAMTALRPGLSRICIRKEAVPVIAQRLEEEHPASRERPLEFLYPHHYLDASDFTVNGGGLVVGGKCALPPKGQAFDP